MRGNIEVIEHTADVALRVQSQSMLELFELAARGFYQIVGRVEGRDSPRQEVVELAASSYEDLLHDWLAEVHYWLDVRQTVFDEISFTALHERGLIAEVAACRFDPKRSRIRTEIKAVTYHNLEIRQEDGLLTVTVVFDV